MANNTENAPKDIHSKSYFARNWMLYVMMIPGLAYLIMNNYLPMFGLTFAFKKINYTVGVWKSPWVGFSNFTYLFKTKDAFIMIRNTLAYNAVWILMDLVIAVFIALC
ncbi:MAG: hypothetical protein IJM73_06635, partial [Spirochaetales bacterium]|nr:hypothetical protein [Spirochaetales bacterium]